MINDPLVDLYSAVYCEASLFLSYCTLPCFIYYFQVKDEVGAERGGVRREFYLYFVKVLNVLFYSIENCTKMHYFYFY